MQRAVIVLVMLLAVGLSGRAFATCNALDFQIKDIENISVSQKINLATLSILSNSQYESAKTELTDKGNAFDGLFKGNEKYEDYRGKIALRLKKSGLVYDEDTQTDFIAQHLSPEAAKMYGRCLEADSNALGLHLWVLERNNEYIKLAAMWVGGKEEVGKLSGTPISDGLLFVSDVPKIWPRAFTNTILVKQKDKSKSGAIVLNVNSDNASFVLAPDPIRKTFTTKWISGGVIGAASGGRSDTTLNDASTCIFADPNAFLDPETAVFTDARSTDADRAKVEWTSRTDTSVCWRVYSKSGGPQVDSVAGAKVLEYIPDP